jgi:LacI family transcriptional regulator
MRGKKRVLKTDMLRDHLLKEMAEQRIPAGGRIPSENELIRRFSVSRTTVRQVLGELTFEGLLERQQGRGTFRTAQHIGGPAKAPGRTMLVGVWFNWPSGPMFGAISEGIRDELAEWGYHAVFESGGFAPEDELRGIRSLVGKGLDGFIISPGLESADCHEPLGELCRRGIPIVLVDRCVPGLDCDLVSVHSERGARQIVEHLIGLGHRRIGFIGIPGISTFEDRLKGYRGVMRRNGIAVDPDWVQMAAGVGRDTGRQATRDLLSLPAARRPTALFGANGWIAVTAAMVARERGIPVPQELSVAGFDDDHIQLEPGDPEWLTTYAQPVYHIGQQAAELLMRRIHEPTRRCTTILLEGQLRNRTSTAPPEGEPAPPGAAEVPAGQAATGWN